MSATIKSDDVKPDPDWLMPQAMWEEIKPLLPQEKPKGKGTKGGRPRAEARQTMDAIFYVLRTGCQWKSLPRSLGSGSTAHEYFTKCLKEGVFERLWRLGLEKYDVAKGIQWQWQAMDGAMTKSPLAVRRRVQTRPTGPRRAPSACC